MQVAITSREPTLDSEIDPRFGRCSYFLIVDDSGNVNQVPNPARDYAHGAGIKAAEKMAELKAEAVVTGELGANAALVLKKLGIPAYRAGGSARKALSDLRQGRLEQIGMQPGEDESAERILFPLENDNRRDSLISEHFGHAPFLAVYDAAGKDLKIAKNTLDHTDPARSPVDQAAEKFSPTTIFAKGIGSRAISIIRSRGINLKTADFRTVGEAIQNLDSLRDLHEGCGHHHRQGRCGK